VTVVSTRGPAGAYGVTVSSFASLSLNPLLITVSVSRTSPLLGLVREAGAFAVSVLAGHQQDVATFFAAGGRRPEPDGFASVLSASRVTGVPVIEGCLSWFDCVLEEVLPGGDHAILVGRVAAAGGATGEPLVYWAGAYRALRDPATAPTDGSGDSARHEATALLAQAADALSVALHLLDVRPDEMLVAQLAVEPALAALAAVHGAAADWDRMDDLIDRAEAAIDSPDEFNELSLGAHTLVADVAGNRVLNATLVGLRQTQAHHYRELGTAASAGAAVREHREIAAALRRADAAAAAALMQEHVQAVRSRFGLGTPDSAPPPAPPSD
jgi:flavin reductase (DIM6/NTAB) family NADH-FMN oxidoreductase RutF/DNA-binding FadR family transcriptional regulator